MNNPKHTPGPWSVLYSSNKYPSIHAGETKTPIAVLYEYVSETDRDLLDNAEANARLIAAAPELLEALENIAASLRTLKKAVGLESHVAEMLGMDDHLTVINHVIAKATGGAE